MKREMLSISDTRKTEAWNCAISYNDLGQGHVEIEAHGILEPEDALALADYIIFRLRTMPDAP